MLFVPSIFVPINRGIFVPIPILKSCFVTTLKTFCAKKVTFVPKKSVICANVNLTFLATSYAKFMTIYGYVGVSFLVKVFKSALSGGPLPANSQDP